LLEEKKRESNDKALERIVERVTTSYEDHFKVFRGKADASPVKKERDEGGIGGWICLGLCILLGIWVVFALIRAFSGGGRGRGRGVLRVVRGGHVRRGGGHVDVQQVLRRRLWIGRGLGGRRRRRRRRGGRLRHRHGGRRRRLRRR